MLNLWEAYRALHLNDLQSSSGETLAISYVMVIVVIFAYNRISFEGKI